MCTYQRIHLRVPLLQIDKSHNTSTHSAKLIVEKMVNDLTEQFGDKASDIETEWKNNIFQFSISMNKITVNGHIKLTEEKIVFRANLPFYAKPFETKIRDKAEQLLDKYLTQHQVK